MKTDLDRSPAWRRAAGLAALVAVMTLLGWIRGAGSYDDAFITYTYAASFARGDGLTWHGAAVLGTSTPFYAVLLGGLEALFPLGVPLWGAAITWISVGVAIVALLALGRREGWLAAAALAAALLPLQAFVHLHVGSEMLPALAAVLVAAMLLGRERWVWAGVALALAAAFRAEAVTAALALAIAHAVARRRAGVSVVRPFGRVTGGFAVAIGGWTVALYAIAGTLVPTTLAAKRAQAESALAIWKSGLAIFPQVARDLPRQLLLLDPPAGGWLAGALLLAGSIALLRGRKSDAPARLALLAWGPLQLAAVASLGVAYYPWYAVPLCFSATLLLAQVGEEVARFMRSAKAGPFVAAAAGAALALTANSQPGWQAKPYTDPRRESYEAVADLAGSFPPGTTLGALEVGYLGLRSRQPVLDLLGLVTPAADPAYVRSGDLRASLDKLDPGLLVLPLESGSLFSRVVGDAQTFVDRYRLERLQLGPGVPVAVYRKSELSSRSLWDLLPDLGRGGATLFARGPRYSTVAARIPAGSRIAVPVPEDVREAPFFGGVITDQPAALRLVLRVESSGGRSREIGAETLRSDAWRRWELPIPALRAGDRLLFECEGPAGASCDLGSPHLDLRPEPSLVAPSAAP